ncbi:hypothetical protein PCASD_05277 [Puccinia coronata f. sp. avenae]|uniref:Uncharacterized protein n=1 Tax=Puccinia coronata f. sp. avenae TaxID=200324 RepID=A0A2N5T373_9BASI|nr:hypothetical protein PCASD_13854 [Puccinia coronata f. sp. avenae]PLW42554.1 hypothetical protein PCASD_05277 [Puccinia coronata f. sp. avenae]
MQWAASEYKGIRVRGARDWSLTSTPCVGQRSCPRGVRFANRLACQGHAPPQLET